MSPKTLSPSAGADDLKRVDFAKTSSRQKPAGVAMATYSTLLTGTTMMARPEPIYTNFISATDDHRASRFMARMVTPHFPIYNSMSRKPLDEHHHHVKMLDINHDNYHQEQDDDVLHCYRMSPNDSRGKTHQLSSDEFAFAELPRLSDQASDSQNAYGADDDIYDRSSIFNVDHSSRVYFDD